MGFFSAVKKFFGQEPAEPRPAPVKSPVSDVSPLSPSSPVGSDGEAAENASQFAAAVPSGDINQAQAPEVDVAADSSDSLGAERSIPTQAGAAGAPACGVEPAEAMAPHEETGILTLSQSEEKPGEVSEPESGEVDPGSISPSSAVEEATNGEREKGQSGDAMLLRLRQAEPRLSAWLAIVLENQDEVNDAFWSRLRFLLASLEAPGEEIDEFISAFSKWLERMDYAHVDEFRSELQYRLALALDLEDEEDERNRLMVKLGEGLAATRARFGRGLDALFASHGKIDEAFWEEMEELFITADMGYETSLEIVRRLKQRAASARAAEPGQVRALLMDELNEVFRQAPRIRSANKPEVILMMGVNGAGKTTTIAKLAYRDILNGKKTLVVAADTFRAAAMEQLKVWAERAGSDFYARPAGSDPASVAWEAMDYALAHDIDVVYIDTAGRLQTRVNLMEELGKIRQVLAKKHPGAPHRNVLVLDATTGQNALSQAKLFKEAAGADEIILTKLDGTAKGGVVIAVAMREELPITFIGLGEKMEDLRPFNGGDFASALLETSSAA